MKPRMLVLTALPLVGLSLMGNLAAGECGPPGDFNCDYVVDAADLAIVRTFFGRCDGCDAVGCCEDFPDANGLAIVRTNFGLGQWPPPGDINWDGIVDAGPGWAGFQAAAGEGEGKNGLLIMGVDVD